MKAAVGQRRIWLDSHCTGTCLRDCCLPFLCDAALLQAARLPSFSRKAFELVVKGDLQEARPHGVYFCSGHRLCRGGYCFVRGISDNVLQRLQEEANCDVVEKVHASLGAKRDSAKRIELRRWMLKEAEEFGDDDPGGSGKIHLALIDLGEWFELYQQDASVEQKYQSREHFDFVLRFDKELKAKLSFSRHVVQKSCEACETWRTTKRNLCRLGYKKGDPKYEAQRQKFVEHIVFIRSQKMTLRLFILHQTFPLYNTPVEELWWILDFDLSYPLQHPTVLVDTDARRSLKQFKSLLFGLRDLTTHRSLILTNPSSGPPGTKGKGSWKGLNVTLSCVFLFMHDAILRYGNRLPENLLFVNDGGERTFALIMLMSLFVAIGWFKKVVSYSCIPGHTHGQTDSLFGLVRKCVRKVAKHRSCSYGEIFELLQDKFRGWSTPSDNVHHGAIAVRELPCVIDFKAFFRGCQSPLMSGELFPRGKSQMDKPHVFAVEMRDHCGVLMPCMQSYITGRQYLSQCEPFSSWVPVYKKYPRYKEALPEVPTEAVFARDRQRFLRAIVGEGIARGAAQGLVLSQVEYYERLTLPAKPALADPFFLRYGFRVVEPEPLTPGRREVGGAQPGAKKRRVDVDQDGTGDSDDKEFESMFDLMEASLEEFEVDAILEMKTKPGGDLFCRVRLRNNIEKWVLRDFVPEKFIRLFQKQRRKERVSESANIRRQQQTRMSSFSCNCGRSFTSQQGLNIHKGKTKNLFCN